MMNYQKVFMPTLQRLSDLIRKQYGCRFEYLNEVELRGQNLLLIYELLKAGKPAISDKAMFFPVSPNGELLGAAKIAGHQKLAQGEISNLNQIIRMVLESTLLNVDRLDTISILEDQLNKSAEGETHMPNIIRLSDHKPAPEIDPRELDRWKLKERLSFPFLIEAQSEEDAFRMALEVHDVSGRNFFAPMEDLEASTFTDLESLKSLGACTIYVSSFDQLTEPIQKTLVDYYNAERGRRSPQIIVGTTRAYSDLKKDVMINSEFLSRLSVGYLYLNQAFSFYKSGDILDFFFDSLTGRAGQSQ